MKTKGRRQSKNVQFDIEVGKNYPKHDVSFYKFDENSKQAVMDRIKRDALRNPEHVDPADRKHVIKDKKARKVAKELMEIHDTNNTPTPTPKPKQETYSAQVTPGKWTTKNEN